MKIGGLQRFTLTDFPGKVAAILFVIGCNFRCSYCHNYKLFDERHPMIPEKEIMNFLQLRKNQLDGIVMSGGEPTIYPDLFDFIKTIKTFNYAIKLDTNGNNPKCLEQLIEQGLIDYIAMDIKAPFEMYDKVTKVETSIESIKKSLQLISHSNLPHEFRTTWDRQLLTQQDIEIIRSLVPPNSIYKVQDKISS